jgi:hypothetical protein
MTAACQFNPVGDRHDQVQNPRRGLAATLATTLTAFGNEAQARPRWGLIGAGIAAGTLIGIAAANSGPVYVRDVDCRFVERMDRWGN